MYSDISSMSNRFVFIAPNQVRVLQLSLLVGLCVNGLVFFLHMPIFLNLKGYSSFQIGFLLGIYNVAGMIGPLSIGAFLDKRPLYKITLLLLSVVALIGLMGIWGFSSTLLVLISMFIFGFALTSIVPSLEMVTCTYLYNPYKEYGIVRSAMSMGYVVACLLLFLFPIVDIQSMFSIAIFGVVIFSIAMLAPILLIPNHENLDDEMIGVSDMYESQNFLSKIKNMHRAFWLLLLLVFFNGVGLRTMDSFLGLEAIQVFQLDNISLFFMISVSSEIIGFYFGQRIVSYVGYIWSWLMVLLATTIRILCLGLIHDVWVLYATQVLHMFSFALMFSIIIHFINHVMKAKNRAISIGMFQTIISFSTMLATVFGGYLLEEFDFFKMYTFMSLFPIIGLIVLCICIPKLQMTSLLQHDSIPE